MIITTGTITAVDGATLPLVYSDSTGDHVESTISNLVAGSRVQIYNTTTSTEVVNEVVAGTSLNYYHIQTGASYRVRATQKGYLPFEGNAVSGGSGFSVLANQLVDSLYNQFNTDGATITEFAWDGANLEVDITDSNNETVIQRIAAWSNYFETTETGIRDFFGAITWEFYNQVKIDSTIANLKLDNKKSEALLLEGGKLYRTDGQSIISATTTGPIHVVGGVGSAQGSGSASLALDYDTGLTVTARVYTMAGATQGALVTLADNGSGLYTGTFALTGVPDGQYLVRFLSGSTKIGTGSLFVRGENEVSQEDFFNPNFDIVQSVSATTTNLDSITLTQFNAEVDTALADYDAPTKAELDAAQVAIIAAVDANEVKIDLLETKTQADARQVILVAEHDATQAAIAGLNNLSLATIEGSPVIAKESTVAAKLDASAYTAPDNAGISAINSRLPAVPASQGDVTALNNLSLAQVEASTVIAKESTSGSIKAKTDNLPSDPADQSLIEAAIAAIPSAPSAASIADEVRVELATELSRIDTTISSRNATTPPTTAQIRTELATELARIDVAISSRNATTPPTASANATAVRSELATELGRLDVATSTRATPAQVASELSAYDAPTKAEMDSAFAALNDFNPATDTVARVTLVDTTTTNTDMRGTNGAITSLVGIATATNVSDSQTAVIAEINVNETKIDAIKTKTDNLPANTSTTLATLATQTSVNNIPTTPLLSADARLNNLDATISSRSTFDPSADPVIPA